MEKVHIRSVGIVVKPGHAEALATARELSRWLKTHGLEVAGDIVSAGDEARDSFAAARPELIVVLGGDGTMISAARMIGDADVLVLGVNYGSLGYLTDFRIEELFPAVEAILAGDHGIDRRVMLDVEMIRGDRVEASGRTLNDVVINKAALARIIEIQVELDDLFVNTFRSDGLIVATPTGSTAYNLSAGGPIVYPSMNAMVLTPICPFTLTNRPIVVPDSSTISLTLRNESEDVVLSLDGQTGYSMLSGDKVVIRKSAMTFNIVQPAHRNYFDVLRNKLKWGR